MKKKAVIIIASVFFAAGWIVLVKNIISVVTRKDDFQLFNKSALALLEKTERLAQKARGFDQKKIVRGLGKNAINGFYYLFDENIQEAQISEMPLTVLSGPLVFSFEFDGTDIVQFHSKRKRIPTEKNMLKIKQAKSTSLVTWKELNIPWEEVGEIEIRAKHKTGKILQLGWSKDANSSFSVFDSSKINVDVIPDNRFHIYSIKAKYAFQDGLNPGERLKKLLLIPSNTNGDEVEIDYIKFLSKEAHYLKEPFGVSYEKIDGETRKVIYARSPVTLTYDITLPQEETFLDFGMSVLLDGEPVVFTVVINDGEEVFSKTVTASNKWHNAGISMKDYSGKSLRISFKVESKGNNVAFWSNPALYGFPREQFNVIIVLQDALRADHMSCYGYSRATTPFTDMFAKNGAVFLNAFAQETKTRPSCPSIMTSLYPSATGVWNFFEHLHDNYLTIAEIMRAQGFQTASFLQNGNAGPLAGLHQGFSYVVDDFDRKNRSRSMFKKVSDWIETHNKANFFLYLHLLDPHGPYDPPQEYRHWYRDIDSGGDVVNKDFMFHDPGWVENPTVEGRRALYDGEISNNDFHFNTLLKKLDELHLTDNTLIILISDHGEHLGEHNLWEHIPPGYVQVIKTPIIMVYPRKIPGNITIRQPVQNIDVMPTILELAGIRAEDLLLEGESLLPLINEENLDFWNNRIALSEEVVFKTGKEDTRPLGSIIFKGTHILKTIKRKMVKFNYLEDEEENVSIDIEEPVRAYYKRFIQKIQKNNIEIWKTLTEGGEKAIHYDPDTVKQLKALGYVQ